MKQHLCIGNCGRLVDPRNGAECRKCRRARVHKGLKIQHKAGTLNNPRRDVGNWHNPHTYLKTAGSRPQKRQPK